MSNKAVKLLNKLKKELPFFSEKVLKIKAKDGQLLSYAFNKAQDYLHIRIESQKNRTGKVRIIIVKGRQQGMSTYVSARYYHEALLVPGQSVFILSHEAKTTQKLFKMVERYYEHTPGPIKPPADTHNRNSLAFSTTKSDYTVGTAGNAAVGRGGTVQFFHGSEVAFWQNTGDIATGVLQSVADIPGTEIILESTANGMNNFFHDKCQEALVGKGEYELVFIPWFWQEEYRATLPQEFTLTQDEEKLKVLYGLDDQQIQWRRNKVSAFQHGERDFKQEYPCNVQEAFQTSGEALCSPHMIMEARKSTIQDNIAPLVFGFDMAPKHDRRVLVARRGREVLWYKVFTDLKPMVMAATLGKLIDQHNPKKCFIDTTNEYSFLDKMKELGYGSIVNGVHFSEGAIQSDVYLNKRTEMLYSVADWINGGGVSIPDDDLLHADIAAIPEGRQNSNNRLCLPPKEAIKKDFGRSPDIMDALALTFAYPVRSDIAESITRRVVKNGERHAHNVKGPLSTLNNMRRYNLYKSRR